MRVIQIESIGIFCPLIFESFIIFRVLLWVYLYTTYYYWEKYLYQTPMYVLVVMYHYYHFSDLSTMSKSNYLLCNLVYLRWLKSHYFVLDIFICDYFKFENSDFWIKLRRNRSLISLQSFAPSCQSSYLTYDVICPS